MTTPILTKKQQRQSLSAKKGPIKGLRNILAQPTENYWPSINIDQYPALVTLMDKLLPLIKQPKYKIPGFMLKNIPKEKRKLIKKEALEKEATKFDKNILKSVILGINAVTRALEKNNVCCVLLDANVEPRLIIKHIIVMAQNKEIPVLLLSTLKTVTLQHIGFTTAAFALKDNVTQSSDNVFLALYKLVAEIFNNFKPPKCSLQLFKPNESENSEESVMCKAEHANTNHDPITSKKSVTSIFTDVYKYRSSRKERAFIPSTVNKSPQVPQTQSDDFIALSNDPDSADDVNIIKTLKNTRYMNICKEESESETIEENSGQSLNELKLIDNSVNSLKYVKNPVSKKRENDVAYMSLKIKRVRGNDHREKATKFTKKKKKL